MTEPPHLSRAERRELLDTLAGLPVFQTEQGRDLLLITMPVTLVNTVRRAENTLIDLDKIINAVEAWGLLDDNTPALLVLLDNALYASQGSNAGRILQELRKSLASPLPI